MNDTVKGNILFGEKEDRYRYDSVIKACALQHDLAMLPSGDMSKYSRVAG